MNAMKSLASQSLAAAALLRACDLGFAARPASQLVHLASFNSTAAAPSPATGEEGGAAPAAIYSACILERLPLVVPQMPAWEIEYAQWQEQLVSRHRKTLPSALIDPKRSGDGGPDGASRWQPAPLETEADRSGDLRLLRRRLDQRIFLLARKRAGGAGATWEFPHVKLEAGETTRAGAERALAEAIGGEGVQSYFVGNAPAGHVALPEGTVVFHRCQLIQGKPALIQGGAWGDSVWAAKDELSEFIKEESTLDMLQKML